MKLGSYVCEEYARLDSEFMPRMGLMRQIARYVLPSGPDFLYHKITTVDTNVYDDTAIHANETLSSAIVGGYMNPANRWMELSLYDETLRMDSTTSRELEYVSNDLLSVLADPDTGFYVRNKEAVDSWTALGTGVMEVWDSGDGMPAFRARSIDEVRFSEGLDGRAECVYRKFKMNLYDASRLMGDEVSRFFKSKTDKAHEECFIHAVMPTKRLEHYADAEGGTNTGKEFSGVYVHEQTKEIVRVDGFYEMPYMVFRFTTRSKDPWGYGPAFNALPSIRAVNLFQKWMLMHGELSVAPPWATPDDGVLLRPTLAPHAVIPGGVNSEGQLLVRPIFPQNNPQITQQYIDALREQIRRTFFVDGFQDRAGTPVSASEYVGRANDRLRLAGAPTSRLEAEYLTQLIRRVLGIRARAGKYETLRAVSEFPLKVKFISPLAKNQKSLELDAFDKFFRITAPIAELNPQAFRVVNSEDVIRRAWLDSGLYATSLKSAKQVADEDAAAAQQAQQMQAAAMAQQGAAAAKDAAAAGLDVGGMMNA